MKPIWKQCLPCPFCGASVEAASSEDEGGFVFWFIECPECPGEMESYHGPEVLVHNWNRRDWRFQQAG